MDAHERRSVAERAARAGAEVAEAAFRGSLEVETKTNPTDFVTDADRAAQRAVIDVIEEADQGSVVVAEEEGAVSDLGAGETAWIVDPIDGTRNFVAGSRIWATSVAAVVDGRAVAAVTRMAAYGDEYALGVDDVTRNGVPVSPSEFDDPAVFTVAPLGWWPRDDRAAFARLCDVLGDRFGDVRRLGCAQATLAMVASGELDAAVATRSMAPWDAVAGAAMVEQAGGTVTDLDGGPWHHGASGLVASNGNDHGALLDAVETIPD